MDLIDREQLKSTIRKMVEIPNETRAQVIGAISRAKAVEFVTENNVGCKCDYCQEDADGYRRMFGAFSIANPFHGSEWFIGTGHCKPRHIYFCPMCGRKLAEPPKGE